MRTKKLAKRSMTIDVESVVDWTECDGCDTTAELRIVDQDTRKYLAVDRTGWGHLILDNGFVGARDLCPECLARVSKSIGG